MAPKAAKKSHNPDQIRGIGKYSRSVTYHKLGLWAIKAKNGGVFPRHDKKPATAEPPVKPPKFYPAYDVKKPLVNKRRPMPTSSGWITAFNLWNSPSCSSGNSTINKQNKKIY